MKVVLDIKDNKTKELLICRNLYSEINWPVAD
jgi:hypothetical protein